MSDAAIFYVQLALFVVPWVVIVCGEIVEQLKP